MALCNRPRGLEQLRRLSDESLCREVAQGNQEAFLVLFDRYWIQVFRLAHAVIRDEAEAEDLAQGLFLEVHASMLRFDERRGSFRTLLRRYAHTRAIDQRRRLESRRFYSRGAKCLACRLVVAINYRHHIAFIKWIGTHADYDEIDVKTVRYGHQTD